MMSEEYWNDDGEVIRKPENHVVWKNAQWAVTEDGFLSAIWCGYHIDPNSLRRGLGGERSWHEHIARKTWVDLAMFSQAFREAVKRNGIPFTEDQMDKWEERALDAIPPRCRPRYLERPLEHYGFWQ